MSTTTTPEKFVRLQTQLLPWGSQLSFLHLLETMIYKNPGKRKGSVGLGLQKTERVGMGSFGDTQPRVFQ